MATEPVPLSTTPDEAQPAAEPVAVDADTEATAATVAAADEPTAPLL